MIHVAAAAAAIRPTEVTSLVSISNPFSLCADGTNEMENECGRPTNYRISAVVSNNYLKPNVLD